MASLFFICPTDFIECPINKIYKGENYFYSSLGNSVLFDTVFVGQLKQFIQVNYITDILFVLAENNRIVSDVINKKRCGAVKGLNKLYRYLSDRALGNGLYSTDIKRQIVVCQHLNFKIKELEDHLKDIFPWEIAISGKIYGGEGNIIKDIYPDLVCDGLYSFN